MRQQGSVKFFDDQKGWGIIRCDDGSELFVHYSQVRGSGHRKLDQDQRVEYVVGQDTRSRPMAVDVAVSK